MRIKKVYLGTHQIYPNSFPYYNYSSDTILYCPLNEDFNDKTWNFTITWSWPITWTYDNIDTTYFNNNYLTTSTTYNRTWNITVSLVAKINHTGKGIVWQRWASWPRNWFVWDSSSFNGLSSWRWTNYTFPTNQRATITVLIPTGSNYPTVYINGVPTWTTTSFSWTKTWNIPIYIWHDGNGSAWIQWYISNVIIENGHRDATKIINRHNKIKDYYWIS